MLQKYFPILGEVNSPLAMMTALDFTATAAELAIKGISNQVLETLLRNAISETPVYQKEVEISASELAAAQLAAKKAAKTLRYRAAQAARSARRISKLSRQVKAVKKPVTHKATLRGLSGLSIEACRSRAAQAQAAVRAATINVNAAHEAVQTVLEGGDVRTIRAAIAALKAAVRTLEVRHIEFKFAREMLAISLARHSA